MRESLLEKCELFVRNRDAIKDGFIWESGYMYPVCAMVFAEKGREADVERMKVCSNLLKQYTSVFSNFRGTVKLAMVAMLAVEPDPEGMLAKALEMYDLLKEHFFSSSYLPLTAMMLVKLSEPSQYGEVAKRTREIYDLMKEEHPFLTSSEDSVFAGLLALSDLSDEQVVEETERCYEMLKPEFFSSNAVQSLSHVLALGVGNAGEKCDRTVDLYEGLKRNGYKYGKEYELATLGVLALLPVKTEDIMRDVMEVDDFLAGQRGYGFFGLRRKERLMHAGMLVTSDYIGTAGQPAMQSAAIGGTVSLIVAQQAAMCAAIAAASASATAAAAASSSSN